MTDRGADQMQPNVPSEGRARGSTTELLPTIEMVSDGSFFEHPDDHDHAVRRRWPGGARALVGLLTVTTLVTAAIAALGFMRGVERGDRIDTLESELVAAERAIEEKSGELAIESDAGAQLQATLDQTNTALADLTARHDRVVAAFPVTPDAFAQARLAGVFVLSNTPIDGACAGFNDAAASCVPANFPTDLTIAGSLTDGYTVSSSWFAPVPLSLENATFSGTGTLLDPVSNTCGGKVNTTTAELQLTITGLLPDEVNGGLLAASLRGSTTISSPNTPECVAASRAADFTTAIG